MANIRNNYYVRANIPLDKKYGPYSSLADAHNKIKIEHRYKGLVFGVYNTPNDIVNSQIIEYYYTGDLSNNSIKIKNEIIVSETEPINPKLNDIWINYKWMNTESRRLDMIIVESVNDLTPFLVGDEYILPPKLVMLNGTIDLGDKAIRLSTNTILRGLANAVLISTNTNGVVRATNIGSAVILREFSVVCFTGPCFVLTGTLEHQLNMFFVGMVGVNGGIITGFDVQGVKHCFVNCSDGLTFAGTTNKVFISESPFYGVTGSAITLSSTLVARVADIVTSFFKFDSPGIAITAQTGYTVNEGKLRGSLIDGTAIPLSGLAASDINWTMTDNTGIADSRIVGGFYLTSSVETVITTPNTPVKVAGNVTGLTLNERFVVNGNRITYTGLQPTIVMFTGGVSIDSGNNVLLYMFLAKSVRDGNGIITGTEIREETRMPVFVGSGQDQRSVPISGLIDMIQGDYVEVWGSNPNGTQNFTALSLNLNGIG